jgi:hypothetical protein
MRRESRKSEGAIHSIACTTRSSRHRDSQHSAEDRTRRAAPGLPLNDRLTGLDGVALQEGQGLRAQHAQADGGTLKALWPEYPRARRPYLVPGTYEDHERHGRLRLVPYFGDERPAPSPSPTCRTGC